MKDKNFDHIIKRTLENLNIPFSNGDWAAFEQKNNLSAQNDATKEVSFDNAIHDKLFDITSPNLPMDWAAMESKLDAQPIEDTTAFEEQYKSTLENLEVAYAPAAWDMMEAQLDLQANIEELSEIDSVDYAVYTKIHNLSADDTSLAWAAFLQKIYTASQAHKKTVFRYKVIELSLMLLFFWGISVFVATQAEHNKVSTPPLPIASTFSTITHNANPLLPNSQESLNSNTGEATTPIIVHKNQDRTTSQQTNTRKDKENLISQRSPTKATNKQIHHTPLLNVHTLNPLPSLSIPSFAIPNNHKVLPLASLQAKDLSSLPTSSIEEITDTTPKTLPLLPTIPPKAVGVRLAMFLTGDYNHIITPSDRLFDINGYDNGIVGYGLGTMAGFSYSKWEVETGIVYSNKHYQPENQVETIGDFELGYINHQLESIQLNILQIPLHIHYNLGNNAKWNAYTYAGASLHAVTEILHNFDSEFTSPQSVKHSLNRNSNLGQLLDERSVFNSKNLSPGWLQKDGSFHENHYFTANIGIGVERSLGTRWTVFSQAMYQHNLSVDGFGLNKDRINTISIFTGVRTQLGKRH